MRAEFIYSILIVWLFTKWSNDMTEHALEEHTLEDQTIMRRLALVVGCFVAFTAALAIGVAIVAG
jgi:hypothetical protein